MKNISRLTPVLLALSIQALSGQVFQYGSSTEYVNENIPFARLAVKEGTGPYVSTNAFSDIVALTPTTGYSGPKVYGGYQFASSTYDLGFRVDQANAGQGIASQLAPAGGYDSLYFNVIVSAHSPEFAATEMSFASVFLFKQEDFNDGFKEGSVSIDGFSLNLYKTASGSGNSSGGARFNPSGRWLLQTQGNYYISDAVFTHNSNDQLTHGLSGEDFQNTLWAEYLPEQSLVFDSSSANFMSLDIQGITAVGIYLEEQHFQVNASTIAMRLGVSEFAVTGSVIPEPAVVSLLVAGGMLVLFRIKRRSP